MMTNTLLVALETAPIVSNSDTLTPAIIGIIGVAVGSVLGFLGNIITTLISNNKQMEREKRTHELQLERERQAHKLQLEREKLAHFRHLEEEQKNRLRQVYARVLYAAFMLQKALAEMQFGFGNETIEERNKRISDYLTPTFLDWEKAKVDLMLEEPDDTVITAYNTVHDAFINYNLGLQANRQVPNTVSIEAFQSYKQNASEAIDKLKLLLFNKLQPGDTSGQSA